MRRINVTLDDQTLTALERIQRRYSTTRSGAIRIAAVKTAREERETMAEHLTHHNSHVTAAQLIDSHQYRRPQYLVQPEGEPSDQDDIDVINGECGYHAVEEAQGWGEYTHVIEVHGDGGPWHYLATLDRAAAPHDAAERREEQHDARTTATSHRSERVQPGRPSGARV